MAGRDPHELGALPCRTCRASQKLRGYARETIYSGSYGIAILIACSCRLESLRRAAQDRLCPGQDCLHISTEPDLRRCTILSMINSLPVLALYATEPGSSLESRTACWRALVPELLSRQVIDLVIESLEGVEAREKGDIGDALRRVDRMGSLGYSYQTYRAEPILRLADAVAWAAGAKGDWQRRIAGVHLRG